MERNLSINEIIKEHYIDFFVDREYIGSYSGEFVYTYAIRYEDDPWSKRPEKKDIYSLNAGYGTYSGGYDTKDEAIEKAKEHVLRVANELMKKYYSQAENQN